MAIRICLHCGAELESKREAKYCNDSCRAKYKRRLTKKHCLQCGKELVFGRGNFCDKECLEKYRVEVPLHSKVCVYCGQGFRANNKKQKLCGVDCQNEYAKTRHIKQREKAFKTKLEAKYPDVEYMSGYFNWNSIVTCRCRVCGHVQERSAQAAKASYACEVMCDNCMELSRQRKALVNILSKQVRTLMKRHAKELQYAEREQRLLGRTCRECGALFDAAHGRQRHCSNACRSKRANRMKEVRRRKRLYRNGHVDYSISLTKLIRRDRNTCYICGGKCDKGDYAMDADGNFIVGKSYPSVEHVHPVSKGGTHTWDNVKLAHHYCNTIKSNHAAVI